MTLLIYRFMVMETQQSALAFFHILLVLNYFEIVDPVCVSHPKLRKEEVELFTKSLQRQKSGENLSRLSGECLGR